MSAKAERVAQGVVDVALSGFVESEIETAVDLRVVVEVVDGRRDNAISEGKDGGNGLHSTSTAQQDVP